MRGPGRQEQLKGSQRQIWKYIMNSVSFKRLCLGTWVLESECDGMYSGAVTLDKLLSLHKAQVSFL